MPRQDFAELLVGIGDVCTLYRVSRETISNWVQSGAPKTSHGKYPLVDFVRWRREQDLAAARGTTGDINEEKRRLIVEQRRGHELDNQQKAAELLEADEVASDMMAYATIVAGQLDALPQRVAPRLVSISDPGIVRKVLTDECRSIRSAASQAVAAYGDRFADGEDSGAAAGARRRAVGRRASRVTAGQPGAGAVEDGSDAVLA